MTEGADKPTGAPLEALQQAHAAVDQAVRALPASCLRFVESCATPAVYELRGPVARGAVLGAVAGAAGVIAGAAALWGIGTITRGLLCAPEAAPAVARPPLLKTREELRAQALAELAQEARTVLELRRLASTFDAALGWLAPAALPGPAVVLNPTPAELARLVMPSGPVVLEGAPRPRWWRRAGWWLRRAGAGAAHRAGELVEAVGAVVFP